MVRLRERTWPTIRNSPLSARIGRTNFTDVSRVGHSSPGLSVVCAASAMDVSSIVMHGVQRVDETWFGRSPQFNGALVRWQEEERQQLCHRWAWPASFCKALYELKASEFCRIRRWVGGCQGFASVCHCWVSLFGSMWEVPQLARGRLPAHHQTRASLRMRRSPRFFDPPRLMPLDFLYYE